VGNLPMRRAMFAQPPGHRHLKDGALGVGQRIDHCICSHLLAAGRISGSYRLRAAEPRGLLPHVFPTARPLYTIDRGSFPESLVICQTNRWRIGEAPHPGRVRSSHCETSRPLPPHRDRGGWHFKSNPPEGAACPVSPTPPRPHPSSRRPTASSPTSRHYVPARTSRRAPECPLAASPPARSTR
jgi:hypothetical protein